VVIVPSKELAEQNAEKLRKIVPPHISVGYYSASLGKKQAMADIIVATIGSIAKNAHVIGNIKCVIVDECHLINPDGAGMYREFMRDLSQYCKYRVVGLTATPFRGNGVWITHGKDPLFCGIAHETKVQELLDAGYLSPLIRPIDAIKTRIDATGVETGISGDYREDQLGEVVDGYVESAAIEAKKLAEDRKKWIAFTPTIATAEHLVITLECVGIHAKLVCGDTPKTERERLIEEYRRGNIRCLVTVMALATGFDVADVDCILWLRPTKSPVLYVQGPGRGLRIAPGKTDCLWLDFTDTTERLGPVDSIKGRAPRNTGKYNGNAPYCLCPECGHHVRPASSLICPECGATIREEAEKVASSASNHAVMEHQRQPKIAEYEVTNVTFAKHSKLGSAPSLRVDYWSGPKIVCKEWICLEHEGFAKAKAHQWWSINSTESQIILPVTVDEALNKTASLRSPVKIRVNEDGKYPKLTMAEFK
jgi:DNA repair protein RadD